MKQNRSPLFLLLASLVTFGAFAQTATADTVAAAVENTGASYPAPTFPAFDYLPIMRPLPDAFRSFDGSRSTSLGAWEKRRNEIKASVEKFEIGRKPDASDLTITAFYKAPGAALPSGGAAIAAGQLIVDISRPSTGKTIRLTAKVWAPTATWGAGPFPAVIAMSGSQGTTNTANYGGLDFLSTRPVATIEFVHNQVTQYAGSTDKRNDAFYQMYPELLPAGTPTSPAQLADNPYATWGSNSGQYAAWSWGVSRLIDGLKLVSQQSGTAFPIDSNYLAVAGCSYAGKMALFAGALDERIALTIPLESGGGGAAAWRISQEIEADQVVETAAQTDAQTFASQLSQFGGSPSVAGSGNNIYKLPHDHHELMGMVAPRALFVTGNLGFNWQSNKAGYISSRATQKIYEDMGIGERFGFVIDGQNGAAHANCVVPTSQNAAVTYFVDKFLLGVADAGAPARVHPYPANLDYQRWTAWWGTTNPTYPRDWIPGNGSAVLAQYRTLPVAVGKSVMAGYAVSLPYAHPAATVSLTGGTVQLDVTSPDGRSRTLTLSLPEQSYASAANDNTWLPTDMFKSASTYQAIPVTATFAGTAKTAIFTAVGKQTTPGAGNSADRAGLSAVNAMGGSVGPVSVKFHFDVGPSVIGGMWGTVASVTGVAADSLIPPSVPLAPIMIQLNDLIKVAENFKAGNAEFPVQVSVTNDGSDVNKAFPWVYDEEVAPLDAALLVARTAVASGASGAIANLDAALMTFLSKIKADGSSPYYRLDPGPGKLPVTVTAPTNVWTTRTPLDARIPPDFDGSTFGMIPYPFADSAGKSPVLLINYIYKGVRTFGGVTMQSPLSPLAAIPAGATIEFDVYYPKSAQGKLMRWRMRNRTSDIDSYLRGYEYNNLNPDWVGSYNGETWLKTHHSVNATTGAASATFILELHGETGRPAESTMIMVSNIKITQPDPNGIALPTAVNPENQSVVAPLKSVYNRGNNLFMVGAIGTGAVTGTRARHYEIFVDGNNLKADGTHPRGPSWLKNTSGGALTGATTTPGIGEYNMPTNAYQAIRDSGTPGQYKAHAHVLAWYNQAPSWMTQIAPATLTAGYTGSVNFYGLGNGVTTTVKVDKQMARRVQFNHTMYVMRHFLTTDTKYGSSAARGIIPFNSWDVLNEEVQESRHSELIPIDPTGWRKSLKHTNWLSAMSDDLIGGDIREHYIYMLFKHAHIAAPNAQMAAAFKANYASLPEYMKLDGHDAEGSIDAYITATPPKLTYNDYDVGTRSKARTIYNMLLELNTAWQSDPLYDGRPLIEDMGIQGHDSVQSNLASNNQYAMSLYASLVDRGLLSGMSYSEFDLKMPTSAPGGGATAPAALNVRQADALGYQYALMYKLFKKFAPYIDHIISWGVAGAGWQGSYVLFDGSSNANAGYYGAMNPDRFIMGHEYLDSFFDGEWEKVQDGYVVDLGDLGTYTTPNAPATSAE